VFLEPGFQVGWGLEVEQGVGEGAEDVGRNRPDACLLGCAERAEATFEQAQHEVLLAFEASFFTSFFAALDQSFLEHLLVETGLLEIGLGELEHDADLVSGEFGEL